MITQDYLKSIIRYEPDTGLFIRLKHFHSRFVNKPTGLIKKDGYLKIKIDNVEYSAGRLAWLYMTGEHLSSDFEIDHKDTNRLNNAWNNLRKCSRKENTRNRNVKIDNLLQVKGVRLNKYGKYEASIKIEGKYKYLGLYNTIEEASNAYKNAANEHYGEFARG